MLDLARPRFRSPLRGPWLTSVFAVVLLIGLPVVALTGLLDYIAYGPGQGLPTDVGFLRLPGFDWPTRPAWLFQLTQGLHVGLGLVLVPVVLAKLWSVLPRLTESPPVRSPAHALERASLLLLVGGVLFEIVTGLLNIQYDYLFGFSFYTAHYLGAWVFLAGFTAHVLLKLPTMVRGLRSRSLRAELRTPLAGTVPERPDSPDDAGLVADQPDPPTISRRGALALVGGGALAIGAITAGQTLGGPLRPLALSRGAPVQRSSRCWRAGQPKSTSPPILSPTSSAARAASSRSGRSKLDEYLPIGYSSSMRCSCLLAGPHPVMGQLGLPWKGFGR